jgi:ABC-2 type transport system permease protein
VAQIDKSLHEIASSDMPEGHKRALLGMLSAIKDYQRAGHNEAGGAAEPAAEPPGLRMPFAAHEEAVTAAPTAVYNGYAHSFAGMSIQFLLFAMSNLGMEILLERQRGLWKRLRSAPVGRLTLLGGKVASGAIISLMVLGVCFAVAILVFGVRIHGSVVGFVAICVACALMAASFGLLVAAVGNSPAAARGITTLAVLMMVMLGGAWVPIFVFPAWLQKATKVVPVRWAVDGFDSMTWRGLPLADAVMPTVMLLGFAVLFSAISVARFRWEES